MKYIKLYPTVHAVLQRKKISVTLADYRRRWLRDVVVNDERWRPLF